MHDNDDSELFEGRIEISNLENGSTFDLDEETYYRMASCAMNAAGMGIEPAMICCLSGNERGCKLVLFGRTHAFSVFVRVLRSCARIDVFAEPLDGLHCLIPLYSGWDCDAHWSHALRAMLAVEGVAYYDSHWAAEQQGDGDGDVEAS